MTLAATVLSLGLRVTENELNLFWGALCPVMPSGQLERPPCGDEFGTLVFNIDVNEVLSCFVPSAICTVVKNTQLLDNGPLRDYNIESDFNQVSLDGLLGLAICLWRAIQAILDAIRIIIGIVAFVLDLIENGIQIPCELIPFFFFFGWADFRQAGPWKHYCMTAVAVVLVSLRVR